MTENQAIGVRGFLLYSPVTNKHFFRVYRPDKKSFTDYRLAAEDIEIQILSGGMNALYTDEQDPEKNRLDYSSRVLGKKRGATNGDS